MFFFTKLNNIYVTSVESYHNSGLTSYSVGYSTSSYSIFVWHRLTCVYYRFISFFHQRAVPNVKSYSRSIQLLELDCFIQSSKSLSIKVHIVPDWVSFNSICCNMRLTTTDCVCWIGVLQSVELWLTMLAVRKPARAIAKKSISSAQKLIRNLEIGDLLQIFQIESPVRIFEFAELG
ncbi:core shell protein, partial [Striga asiatica]